MKKTLLLLTFLATAFTASLQAQTLTFTELPNNVPLGSAASFELSYTSEVPAKMEVSLNIFGLDDQGNLVQDWNGTWQAGTIVTDLPATATATPQTIVVNVPGAIAPSSQLPANKTYVWALSLKTASDGWITGSQHAVTLIPSGTVVDDIDFVGTTVATVAAGTTADVGYSYTLTEPRNIKVALSKYNSSGGWMGDIVSTTLEPAPATTVTPVQAVANLAIPSGTVPSDMLQNGENYKWEIGVFTTGWGYLMGSKSDVTVTTSMRVEQGSMKSVSVYPNPASGMLSFAGIEVSSAAVYDVTGKILLNIEEENMAGIDVSSLANGIYIVQLNNTSAIKFIKN